MGEVKGVPCEPVSRRPVSCIYRPSQRMWAMREHDRWEGLHHIMLPTNRPATTVMIRVVNVTESRITWCPWTTMGGTFLIGLIEEDPPQTWAGPWTE